MSHKNQRQSCKRFITHLNTFSFLVLYLIHSHSLGCHTTYTKKVWGYAMWINKKREKLKGAHTRTHTHTHAHTHTRKEKKQSRFQVSFQLLVQQCLQLRGSLIFHFFTVMHICDLHIFPVKVLITIEDDKRNSTTF